MRQETQEIVADSLESLGIDVEIVRVRVDDFFSADPKETDSLNHFLCRHAGVFHRQRKP